MTRRIIITPEGDVNGPDRGNRRENMQQSDWNILAKRNVTPDNLTVHGWLDLRGTAITALYVDERSYRLDRAGNHYHAGCRRFTAAEAIAHWGSDTYPNKARGAAFVAAVEAEEARRAAA